MRHAQEGFDLAVGNIAFHPQFQGDAIFASAKQAAQCLGLGHHAPRLGVQHPRLGTYLHSPWLTNE